MPTNLPDPPGRKEQDNRAKFLVLGIALGAYAMIVWLWLAG
jgi:hypothetical protein